MAGTLETRDVVLKPLSDSLPSGGGGGGGGGDCCPHPDPSKAAMGVAMHRVVTEKKLYLQLSSYHREMHVTGAVKRVVAQLRASDPRNAPRSVSLSEDDEPPLSRTSPPLLSIDLLTMMMICFMIMQGG